MIPFIGYKKSSAAYQAADQGCGGALWLGGLANENHEHDLSPLRCPSQPQQPTQAHNRKSLCFLPDCHLMRSSHADGGGGGGGRPCKPEQRFKLIKMPTNVVAHNIFPA